MVPWVVLARRVYFPEELLLDLLKTLDPNERRDRRALLACLRVSQQFRSIAHPLAYATARAYSKIQGPAAYGSVIQYFTTYASVAHTVTTLVLCASSAVPWYRAASFPYTDICTLTTIGTILYRLQTLRLYRVAITPCTCPTHSHRWTSGFHLKSLELQCVNIPLSTMLDLSGLSLTASIDVLKVGEVSAQEDASQALSTRIPHQHPLPGPFTLSTNAVEVHPATRRALRRLSEVKIENLTSLQLGEVDWTAWRTMGRILNAHKSTLRTLVVCMEAMEDENVEGEQYSSTHDRGDAHTQSGQILRVSGCLCHGTLARGCTLLCSP